METLMTAKGNVLANNGVLCAFFDKSGKLLREATQEEWTWAKSRMAKADIDINFDFSSIIEDKRKKEQKALNDLISFAGQQNAEKIISFFGKEPGTFKIAGQMWPDWEDSAVCAGGCAYSHQEQIEAWMIEEGEIKPIKSIMTWENGGKNANGSTSDGYGFTADYLAKNSNAPFFLIHKEYRYVTDHGINNEIEEGEDWSIYRRPNMAPIWEEWREMADKKLEEFFFDIKRISAGERKAFAEIIRSLINDQEIIKTNLEAMDSSWEVSATSEGNDMYSDYNEYVAWAVDSDKSLNLIRDKAMVSPEQREGMPDYAVTPYGYDFSYLKAKAPKALFFILKESHEWRADRQPSATSRAWHLLRVLSRKELMIKKINSENNKKYTLGDLISAR